MLRRCSLLLLLAVALAGIAVSGAAAAPRNTDPCHQRHSCPSDHHSYVWVDSAGKGWDCAKPGASELVASDTHKVSFDGYPYLCHAAGTATAPATPTPATPSPSPATGPPPPALFSIAAARKEIAALPVKPAGPMSGYSRAQFGPAWEDVDGNHCDTRDDILRRDLTQIVFKTGSTCEIASGILHDPYTGKTIHFLRGIKTSAAVQIDHIVPLADAWRTGAAAWSATVRLHYANDPYVLVAADGPANEQKSDSDASGWLPPFVSDRCQYVAHQLAVKTKYRLWLTAPEKSAIATVLRTCR